MNRFKREIRRKGILLEDDYPFLPFSIGDLTLISVTVDTEKAKVIRECASILIIVEMDRSGNLKYYYE